MVKKSVARGKSRRQRTTRVKATVKIVATNMRNRRGELDWTQAELAKKAGVYRSYVGKIERNEHTPNISSLVALADALDISISKLFEVPAEKPSEASKTGPKRR